MNAGEIVRTLPTLVWLVCAAFTVGALLAGLLG